KTNDLLVFPSSCGPPPAYLARLVLVAVFLAVQGRPDGRRDVERRVDQRYMRKRLREIAAQAARVHVVLLRQEANGVAQGKEALEEGLGLVMAPEQLQVVGQPEGAHEERPLALR